MNEPSADEVRDYIAAGLRCEHLAVEGDGRHFFATIVSPEFEGPAAVGATNGSTALGDRMREQIHALSMKTLTPPSSPPRGARHDDARRGRDGQHRPLAPRRGKTPWTNSSSAAGPSERHGRVSGAKNAALPEVLRRC